MPKYPDDSSLVLKNVLVNPPRLNRDSFSNKKN